jgi:hypothetical protein
VALVMTRPHHEARSWWLCVALVCLPGHPTAAVPIEVSCVDADAIGYATFQSHNQKVAANRAAVAGRPCDTAIPAANLGRNWVTGCRLDDTEAW